MLPKVYAAETMGYNKDLFMDYTISKWQRKCYKTQRIMMIEVRWNVKTCRLMSS